MGLEIQGIHKMDEFIGCVCVCVFAVSNSSYLCWMGQSQYFKTFIRIPYIDKFLIKKSK